MEKVNGAVEYLKIKSQVLEKDHKDLKDAYDRLAWFNETLYQDKLAMKHELDAALSVIRNTDWFL